MPQAWPAGEAEQRCPLWCTVGGRAIAALILIKLPAHAAMKIDEMLQMNAIAMATIDFLQWKAAGAIAWGHRTRIGKKREKTDSLLPSLSA
jgi:hypothetical protein